VIDPVAALVEHLAQYLQEQDGISLALRGWPERREDLDLSHGPVVSVTPVEHRYTWCAPVPVAEADDDDGGLLVTYRLADLAIVVQLDLWCAHRAVRDQARQTIETALHTELPHVPGLELELPMYFGQVANVLPDTGRALDDADAVATGEWRQRWVLACDLGLVAQGRTPAQALIKIRTTTQLAGVSLTEPDVEIP